MLRRSWPSQETKALDALRTQRGRQRRKRVAIGQRSADAHDDVLRGRQRHGVQADDTTRWVHGALFSFMFATVSSALMRAWAMPRKSPPSGRIHLRQMRREQHPHRQHAEDHERFLPRPWRRSAWARRLFDSRIHQARRSDVERAALRCFQLRVRRPGYRAESERARDRERPCSSPKRASRAVGRAQRWATREL